MPFRYPIHQSRRCIKEIYPRNKCSGVQICGVTHDDDTELRRSPTLGVIVEASLLAMLNAVEILKPLHTELRRSPKLWIIGEASPSTQGSSGLLGSSVSAGALGALVDNRRKLVRPRLRCSEIRIS